jgi:hypothetical protein
VNRIVVGLSNQEPGISEQTCAWWILFVVGLLRWEQYLHDFLCPEVKNKVVEAVTCLFSEDLLSLLLPPDLGVLQIISALTSVVVSSSSIQVGYHCVNM